MERNVYDTKLQTASQNNDLTLVQHIVAVIFPEKFLNCRCHDCRANLCVDYAKYAEKFRWLKKSCLIAAQYNRVTVFSYLFSLLKKIKDTDIVQGRTKKTPLDFAIEKNHIEMVKFLLNQENATKTYNPDGFTYLHRAAKYGRVQIAQLLVQLDPKLLNSSACSDQTTPLHIACTYNRTLMVVWLLEQDAQINSINRHASPKFQHFFDSCMQSDPPHSTALISAIQRGHQNIVRILLEHNFNPNEQDIASNSALHHAIMLLFQNNIKKSLAAEKIINLLLLYKADITITNDLKQTPLALFQSQLSRESQGIQDYFKKVFIW